MYLHQTEQFCRELWLTVDKGGLEEVSEVREEGTWVSVEGVPVNKVSVEGVSVERVAGEALVAGVGVSLSENKYRHKLIQ